MDETGDNMLILLFAVCFFASALGTIAGFGGGVIIRPVIEATGLFSTSVLSFMTSCTVLAMSASSLIRGRSNGVHLRTRISTPIGIGAALGGVYGKLVFDQIKQALQNDQHLSLIQNTVLLIVLIATLLYVLKKERLRSFNIENPAACLGIGTLLGLTSSFLGIGGGPYNVAVLFLCFSMEAKEAAKNSIYIILFSQSANLLLYALRGNVPDVSFPALFLMMGGGVFGALAGNGISKRMNGSQVEKLLRILIAVIICITCYNIFRAC